MWLDRYPEKLDRIRRSSLTYYFGLAYGLSWGGILLILGIKDFRFSLLNSQDYALIFAAMVLGPSSSSLILTGVLYGRTGLSELWLRIMRWRVGGVWYAVALFTTPVIVVPVLFVMSALSRPAYTPRFQPALFSIGLIAGAFEEIGWSGFATPRLLEKHATLKAGIGLGIVWAVWHVLADYSGNITTMGADWPLWFSVFWLATLPPYRLLMTSVYAKTESVLINMLMHAGYTGWLLVLSPAISVRDGLVWQAAFAMVLWIVVGVVVFRGAAHAMR